jgi:hypothetical protein
MFKLYEFSLMVYVYLTKEYNQISVDSPEDKDFLSVDMFGLPL